MSHLPILSSQVPNSGKLAAAPGTATAPAEDSANVASPFGEFLAKHLVSQGGTGLKADLLKRLVADSDPQAADIAVATGTEMRTDIPAGSDLLAGLLPQDKLAALAATENTPAAPITAPIAAPVIDGEVRIGQATSDAPAARIVASDMPQKEAQQVLEASAHKDTAQEKLPATTSATNFAATLQAQEQPSMRTAIAQLGETAQAVIPGGSTTPPSGIVPAMNMAAPAQASAPAQAAIPTPVGQPQWGDDFSQKVTWLATQRTQSAELHLNPAQLGPVEISLKLNGDQASLQFTSAHAAVRDAIEQSLPRLRDMLAESGISLGNTTVSDQAPREQQQRDKTGGMNGHTATGDAPEEGAVQAQATTLLRRHDGMVDTFA